MQLLFINMRGSDPGADIITRKEPPTDLENWAQKYYLEMPVKSRFISLIEMEISLSIPYPKMLYMVGSQNLVSPKKCNFFLR